MNRGNICPLAGPRPPTSSGGVCTIRSGKPRTPWNKWNPSVAALILYTIIPYLLHLTYVKRSYWLLSYSRPSSPAMELKGLKIPYSKSYPLPLKPRQFDQFGNVATFLKIRLILSFYLRPGLPSDPFLSGIPTKSLCNLHCRLDQPNRQM